ncbi:hypothetical protein ZOSMA_324G00010 [Zostera marina]|uniref:Uncharacterized protein n=1 Tax=Zostera marina TaxID=29655 RepID=A0A0K9PAS2_ZOSMR|nr:hypothetical protein ZOSMA_324G00010 [Zostera marina]
MRQLVHYVNRDSFGLANDFLSLGFIPEGADLSLVADALQAAFSDGTRHSKDFQGVMNQLYDVMYEFNFSLPPDYALVIRALGSLEGTAKALDPDFKVVESAYPFVIGRLLADSNRDMRKILRQLLICNDGSVRWNQKGRRVRVFLILDIIKAYNEFLDEQAYPCIFDRKADRNNIEEESIVIRVVNRLQSLRQAVKLAPEAWRAMIIRLIIKPEIHVFGFDIMTAFARHSYHKIPSTFWLCISRSLHNFYDS